MILPDTSVWIEHIHREDQRVASLPRIDRILIHPFVIGEISLGSMKRHDAVFEALMTLRSAPVLEDQDIRFKIKQHELMGTGIGYVDAHLLAQTQVVSGASLRTRDTRLNAVARRLGVARAN